MARKKYGRFKVARTPTEIQNHYWRFYDSKALHFQPETLPPITSESLFGNVQQVILDIGCGRGDFIIGQATQHPATNFIGFDLHFKSLWDAMNKTHAAGLENIRYLRAEVPRVFIKIPDNTIQQVYVLFPPVKKEDFINPSFLVEIARILAWGGGFCLMSDQPDYIDTKIALIETLQLPLHKLPMNEIVEGVTWFQRHWERAGFESHRVDYRKLE
jgi:tRNA (guanine-N7-)-methyltransferase